MAAGPTGTVTFLFTDIEGSTRRWEADPVAMRDALANHDHILRDAIARHQGFVFATGGDGFAIAFATAADAVECATEAQQQLQAAGLPPVRMGLHTGEAVERDGDYFGPDVNRTARLMAIAHGGQIVLSATSAQLANAGPVRDLGEHRLRDLSQPERVHQLVIDGLSNDFPPLRSLHTGLTNLPVQMTSFIGREADVESIAMLLLDGRRMVTIVGVGGVGKTRLGLQVAGEALPGFDDGAWLCELAPVDDADAMEEAIASTLGVTPRPGVTLSRSIVESLRTKQMLVVLDNCEHMIDDVAGLAEDLLAYCPQLRVLATSREALGVSGEQVWPLRSLEMPADATTPESVGAASAGRLFVERARSVVPDFMFDDTMAGAVGEICRRLDGIPLAIELAAARTVSMHPSEIAALLNERFRLLTGGRRRSVERHQTLRATVDWSYSLLGERERVVFDRLGVFAGSFDAEAAQAVVTSDEIERFDVIDSLGDLVAKSMLVTAGDEHGSTRYQLLETLRQYALEQLDARQEADVHRRRHATFYAQLSERYGPELSRSDEIRARQCLVADLDNLRAAVTWALEAPEDEDALQGLRVIAAAALLVTTARSSGLGGWAERASERLSLADPGRRLAVLGAAIFGAANRGDFEAGKAYVETAESLGLPPDCPAPVLAFGGRAVMLASTDFHGAIEILQQAIPTLAEIGDRYGSVTLENIVVIFQSVVGDYPAAQASAARVLQRAREIGNPTVLVTALYAFGMAWWRDAPERALAALEESLALTEAGASDIVFGDIHEIVGRLRWQMGDTHGALRAVRDAFTHADTVGNLPTVRSSIWYALPIFVGAGAADLAAVVIGITEFGAIAQAGNKGVGPDAEQHDRTIAEVQEMLTPEHYEELMQHGTSMTYEELVAFVKRSIGKLLEELEVRQPG